MLRNVSIFEAAKEVIENAPLIPAWEAKFRQEAIIRTVHHGTRIEGNELNFTEAQRVVEAVDAYGNGVSPQALAQASGVVARARDIQEVFNYRLVLDFINRFKDEQTGKTAHSDMLSQEDMTVIGQAAGKITDKVLLHIHKRTVEKILPPHECGAFRKTQVVVKNSQTGEITFRPPSAIEVPFLITDFLEWLNKTDKDVLHPALKAGVTHYELVRIHPFLDGNGRVARAAATLLLFLDGYDIKQFFSLDEYYDQDALRYYDSLQSVDSRHGDLTGWLEYFSEGIAIELNRVKEKVKSLSRDIKIKEQLGGKQVALTKRQLKIVEYMQKVGYLQNKMFFEVFPMVSEDTVLRDVTDLIKKGIVTKEGSTKGARYVLVK